MPPSSLPGRFPCLRARAAAAATAKTADALTENRACLFREHALIAHHTYAVLHSKAWNPRGVCYNYKKEFRIILVFLYLLKRNGTALFIRLRTDKGEAHDRSRQRPKA